MPRTIKPGDGLNDQQRHLAEYVAQGHSLVAARKLAGYAASYPIYGKDSIVDSVEFKYYLFSLREKAVERTHQTMELLIRQLDDARLLALMERDPGAMIAAVVAKAKLLGMVGDRGELDLPINKPSRHPTEAHEISLEEWQRQFGEPQKQLQ